LHDVFNRREIDISASHNVYVNVTWCFQKSRAWHFQLLTMFMYMLHDVFNRRVLSIFNFSQCLCNCYMMVSIEESLTLLTSKCLCKCYMMFSKKQNWTFTVIMQLLHDVFNRSLLNIFSFSQCLCKCYMMFSIASLTSSFSHNVYVHVTCCFQ
jgi:hypothetical protein